MIEKTSRPWRLILLAVILLFAATSGAQDGNPLQQTVNGIEIYLGIVPAEMARGYPRRHPERKMHDGATAVGYHVMVALFEQATGKRITDAEVSVRIGPPSRPGPDTRLEPMTIAGAQSYGNYLDMSRGGTYRIDLQIHRPRRADSVRATFHWSPP